MAKAAIRVVPMDEILTLKSGDFEGSALRDVLHLVDFNGYEDFYGKLRARMAELQTNAVPIEVEGEWLINGHHRVVIANELGFTEMNVTDDYGWHNWRKIV